MKTKLIIALILVPGIAQAQQTPLFQQVNSRPKGLSNLAEPTQTMDSFLGQDKVGPYVLTWKNIVFAPGYPVFITIDGNLLKTSEYNLNSEKGEITFNSPIKRTQVVNVKYGYFPEASTRNANPALTNPLTIKLASNSFQGLTFTAMNPQNLQSAPAMVFGHTYNANGLTSSYFANPTGKGMELQDAMKFGYNLGKTNSLNASYEKSNKGFAGLAKNFGMIESAEKSNLGGKYSLAKNSNLSFNNSSFKSLNSIIENNNTNAQFNFTGTKNQPSFNYSFNDTDGVDAKNIKTSNTVQSANLNSAIGQGNFAYQNNQSDSATNGTRSVNNHESFTYKAKQFNASRTNDFKIDPKLGTVSNSTDVLSYATRISGGNASFLSNKSDSVINNKEVVNTSNSYAFDFKGNKSGFTGLNFNRFENNIVSGSSETNIVNNKASIGFGTLSFRTNTVITQIGDMNRKDLIDDSFSASLPARKSSPQLSFSQVDSIKRNDKGVMIGSSNNVTSFRHQVSSLLFSYKFGNTTTFNPDGNAISVDNSTGNFSARLGKGILSSESVNNQIINGNNKPINQEISRFNYSLVPLKNAPGFDFERVDNSSTQDVNTTNAISDQIKLTSKVGSTTVSASSIVSNIDVNSTRLSDIKNNSVSLKTPIWGPSTNISVNASSFTNAMPNGDESKTGIGVTLSPTKSVSIVTEQLDSRFAPNNGQVTNFTTTNRYGLNLSLPGALLQTTVNTSESNTVKSDVFDYRTVLGNDKTLFKVDSTIRMRDSNNNSTILNKDTTQTLLNLNPAKNLQVSGSYVLNPDDPTKPGQTIPVEKRTYGMNARLGRVDLNGSYSSMEHLPGTASDVIAKAGGFTTLGESGIKLGYKAGSTSFYSDFRNQFYYGSNLKGINTYTIGLTQNRRNLNFSLNGTVIQNRNNSVSSQDYRAEAKLAIKF